MPLNLYLVNKLKTFDFQQKSKLQTNAVNMLLLTRMFLVFKFENIIFCLKQKFKNLYLTLCNLLWQVSMYSACSTQRCTGFIKNMGIRWWFLDSSIDFISSMKSRFKINVFLYFLSPDVLNLSSLSEKDLVAVFLTD